MPIAITPPATPAVKVQDLSVPKTSMAATQNPEIAEKKRKIICFSGMFCSVYLVDQTLLTHPSPPLFSRYILLLQNSKLT